MLYESAGGNPALHLGVDFLLLDLSLNDFYGPVPDLAVKRNTHKNVIVRVQESETDLHGVVNGRIFVEEPKHAIVRLCVDALLLEGRDLFRLASDQVKFQHLEERVSILRGKLNCKVQIVLSSVDLKVFVLLVVSHRDTSTFTPYLTRLGNFSQSLVESVECSVEVLLIFCSCMLQLDECCPKTACGKVNSQ